MAIVSVGFGFLMFAVLVPGSPTGSAIALATAAVAAVLSLRFPYWMVIGAGCAAAAIGLGTQSAPQTALAGMAATIAIVLRFAKAPPEPRVAAAIVVGGGVGAVAAMIPLTFTPLALVAPVLVVVLFAAVLAPLLSSHAE